MARHGRYTILGKLADGGMAEIFLATQHGAEGFEKHVVLKRILTQFSADPQFGNMLLDEGHISMTLQHSNIVQVLDLGVAGGRYFLALELVDGWDLERILVRAHAAGMVFPPALALYIVTVVCRALAYAHGKTLRGKPLGIVHRDISPNNVLISEQGEIKLADFGIAKAQRKREQTAAGVIKGKVAYMSPEQATGTAIDKRSDIFSVGSLMYRMMTDKLPFEAPSDLEQLLKVQKANFEHPDKVKKGVSKAVSEIIMRAMRLAPSERYQDAGEMLADVERVLRTEFHSAGQTELKSWLEQLARRDGTEPIGKRRLDTSGIVKDELGTDLSAGTSFELDEVMEITSGITQLASSAPRHPPTPPPLVVGSKPETTVDQAPRGREPTPPPLVTPPLVPARRRMGGFWLGAIFALGAVVGIRYLFGLAEREGALSKLGLGEGGAEPAGAAGAPVAGPPSPPPAPTAPVAGPLAPVETPPLPGPVQVPTPTPALIDAGPPPTAVAAAAHDAAAATAAASHDAAAAEAAIAAAEEEPDEEALLRTAVPNAEQTVIGAQGAEPPKPEAEKPTPPEPEVKPPHGTTKATPPAPKPKPPAKETAILHIRTSPVGAVVKTKYQVLGRTPLNLHFRTGNVYELTFVKSGYQQAVRTVNVTNSKDRTVALSLRKKTAAKKRSFLRMHR